MVDIAAVNQGAFMKSGDKVKVIRESNNLYFDQVIEVMEVVDKYRIKIESGFMRKTISKSDVQEIHLN